MDSYKRHIQLCRICSELGKISDWHFPETQRLADKIAATGKDIEELTVGELLRLSRN